MPTSSGSPSAGTRRMVAPRIRFERSFIPTASGWVPRGSTALIWWSEGLPDHIIGRLSIGRRLQACDSEYSELLGSFRPLSTDMAASEKAISMLVEMTPAC